METNRNFRRYSWCITGLFTSICVASAHATLADLSSTSVSRSEGGTSVWQWDGQTAGTGVDSSQRESDLMRSLDAVQLVISGLPNQLNSGGRNLDMTLYVPDDHFSVSGTDADSTAYLFSLSDKTEDEIAGGKEQSLVEPGAVVPEPATLSLLLMGMACIAYRYAPGRASHPQC